MCQTCRQYIEERVNKKLCDPVTAKILTDVLAAMNGGEFSPEYCETLVGKGFRRSGYDIYDAHVLAQLHVRYFTGGLLSRFVCFTRDGITPFRDAEKVKNNEALAWLEKPFRARFEGGLGPGDGCLEWTEPIPVRRLIQNAKTGKVKEETVIIKPQSIPLEVGSSSYHCTWHHMWDSMGVARWPYGHEYITLLLRSPEGWPSGQGDQAALMQQCFDFT